MRTGGSSGPTARVTARTRSRMTPTPLPSRPWCISPLPGTPRPSPPSCGPGSTGRSRWLAGGLRGAAALAQGERDHRPARRPLRHRDRGRRHQGLPPRAMGAPAAQDAARRRTRPPPQGAARLAGGRDGLGAGQGGVGEQARRAPVLPACHRAPRPPPGRGMDRSRRRDRGAHRAVHGQPPAQGRPREGPEAGGAAREAADRDRPGLELPLAPQLATPLPHPRRPGRRRRPPALHRARRHLRGRRHRNRAVAATGTRHLGPAHARTAQAAVRAGHQGP